MTDLSPTTPTHAEVARHIAEAHRMRAEMFRDAGRAIGRAFTRIYASAIRRRPA